ncbi:MAG TPA: transglycosylase domain-containing protein, partial [Thermopolyspora sp.]
AVGGAAIAARDGSDALIRGVRKPRMEPLPERVRLLDRNGKQFAQFYLDNRMSVPLTQVAPVMRQAMVAIEDARFYQHGAIDLWGTLRALIANSQAGEIQQGGSSLTQQLVKNILVENADSAAERARARAPSLERKITELRYALAIEREFTKDQILERYLNIAYFGSGAFGIEAAARRFFGVHASALTLPQAATLAGAVRTPSATDPAVGQRQRARLLKRRDLVLDRMADVGVVTRAAAGAAKRSPLGLRMRSAPGGCSESAYPFFCRYVYQEMLLNPAFGPTEAERKRRLQRGGLIVRTTLAPAEQHAADRAIRARVHPRDTQVASEAMVEPGTGKILAIAVSKKYGPGPSSGRGPNTTYNLAADVAHGGGLGLQAGSTFKVFTLATALNEGWRFDQGYDTPSSFSPSSGYTDCAGNRVNDENTVIHNAGGEGESGPYSLSTGTWKSVNIFYMMLERKVGLCDVVRMARSLGIRRADGKPLSEVPTFTLGVNEVDPVTVAASFAAFAARGRYCHPMAITDIIDRNGHHTRITPRCSHPLEKAVADAVSYILSGVFDKGTMRGQSIGRPVAGKTGTNNGYTAAWFAGYTPDLAAAISVGDIRGAYRYPLIGVTIGGEGYGAVQGASLPGPIWVDSMEQALRDTPPTPFVAPDMARFGGGFTPGLEGEDRDDPDHPHDHPHDHEADGHHEADWPGEGDVPFQAEPNEDRGSHEGGHETGHDRDDTTGRSH